MPVLLPHGTSASVATVVGAVLLQLAGLTVQSRLVPVAASWAWSSSGPKCDPAAGGGFTFSEGATVDAGSTATIVCSNGGSASPATVSCPGSTGASPPDNDWWAICGSGNSCASNKPLSADCITTTVAAEGGGSTTANGGAAGSTTAAGGNANAGGGTTAAGGSASTGGTTGAAGAAGTIGAAGVGGGTTGAAGASGTTGVGGGVGGGTTGAGGGGGGKGGGSGGNGTVPPSGGGSGTTAPPTVTASANMGMPCSNADTFIASSAAQNATLVAFQQTCSCTVVGTPTLTKYGCPRRLHADSQDSGRRLSSTGVNAAFTVQGSSAPVVSASTLQSNLVANLNAAGLSNLASGVTVTLGSAPAPVASSASRSQAAIVLFSALMVVLSR